MLPAPVGALVQVTAWLLVNCWVWAAVSVTVLGDAVGARVPVPVSATVCGLPPALSVTETAPVREPAAVGVKVAEIVQVPAAASDAPHVLVWLKSPLAAMLVMVSAADPVTSARPTRAGHHWRRR